MTAAARVEPMAIIAPTESQTLGLRPVLRDAAALLLGIACLMAGNGLSSTLLGTRAGIEGFRPGITGIVLAGFYAGFVIGSLVAPSTIARVGHIRVFAGLASLGSASILIHVIDPVPATWCLSRSDMRCGSGRTGTEKVANDTGTTAMESRTEATTKVVKPAGSVTVNSTCPPSSEALTTVM